MAVDNLYEKELSQAAADYGVPVEDLRAIRAKESGGTKNPATAVSPKGATGPMQLMPATAKDLGVDPTKAAENIRGGAAYYSRLLEKYDGDKRLALTAYNWGPGNTDKWISAGSDPEQLPKETKDYIDTIAPVQSPDSKGAFNFKLPSGQAITINAPSLEAAQKGLKKVIAGQRHEADINTFASLVDMTPTAPKPQAPEPGSLAAYGDALAADQREKMGVYGAPDFEKQKSDAQQAGIDITTGVPAKLRVQVGLLSDSPEAQRAALEHYVADGLKKQGIKLPDGVPAVFMDEHTKQLAYWRPTGDGKLKPTLVNAPGIDAGDFAEFAPTAVSAVVEGAAAGTGAVIGGTLGPAGAVLGAAAFGARTAEATTFARVAAAKLMGVPDEIANKIGSEEAFKNALVVGGAEVAFPVVAGVVRGVRNMGRFITAGDTERLNILKDQLDNIRVSKNAIKASTGEDVVPTFGGATMDPEVALQQANLKARSVGSRAFRMGEEEIMRKQASANAVQKLTDNVVDVGPRLTKPVPAEDLGDVVKSTIRQPSDIVRGSVTTSAADAERATLAAQMNARRVADSRASMEDMLARQDAMRHNAVYANLQDDVAGAQTKALADEKEARQIFGNHVEFDPETHQSNVLLDNPADSPIQKAIGDLDAQGQAALSRTLARSKQSLVNDLGFKPEEAEGEAAIKSLADEHLDVYQLDVLRSHLIDNPTAESPKIVAAIDEQIGSGSYRRASTNRPIPKKSQDIKDSLMNAQQATKYRKDTFETDAVQTLLRQDAKGAFEMEPSQVATYVLNKRTPNVLRRVLDIVGNNPEKKAALLEELDRMHTAAVYPGGKYSEAANQRFLNEYQDQLGMLNDFNPTGKMLETKAAQEAQAQAEKGHIGQFVRNAEDMHNIARAARARADRVSHALSNVYGTKIGAEGMYSGNLAKDMMSDRLTSDQAAKIVQRLDQLHPALSNEVKDKVGQWVTNKLITRGGNDTNAKALEKLLQTHGAKLEKIYGKEYVDNLQHMSVLLGGEEFMKMVKPTAKEVLPFAMQMTRTLFGPLSKIQREFTAIGRAKVRTQEYMLDKLLTDPTRLDAYMKLTKLTKTDRAYQAMKVRAGLEGVDLPQEQAGANKDESPSPIIRQLRQINSRPRQ